MEGTSKKDELKAELLEMMKGKEMIEAEIEAILESLNSPGMPGL